jgi:hypothetical protein
LVRVDSADILFYGARWQNNGTVQIHTGNFTSSTVSDTISAGDWIGIEVENTGANTTWRVWRWATDPGDRAVWGSPKGTWGVGGKAFTLAVYSNTYLYAGLADLGNATKAIYDDFYANSSAYRAPRYVSSSCSATWANAWNPATPASLATAFSNAAAGDVVYLRGVDLFRSCLHYN